jgi:hypothetical protein
MSRIPLRTNRTSASSSRSGVTARPGIRIPSCLAASTSSATCATPAASPPSPTAVPWWCLSRAGPASPGRAVHELVGSAAYLVDKVVSRRWPHHAGMQTPKLACPPPHRPRLACRSGCRSIAQMAPTQNRPATATTPGYLDRARTCGQNSVAAPGALLMSSFPLNR